MEILISAGEASGDLHASELVAALRRHLPDAAFFGCAGERMKAAGVEAVVDAASLSVLGIVELPRHLPRIWGEFRKLLRTARERKPDLAILVDSAGFHITLGLARRLRALGIPVVYLIAPQAWAWRRWRVKAMARDLRCVLCIYPFEEAFFRERGVDARYIGNPLARIVRPAMTDQEFWTSTGLDRAKPLITLLPGSRPGEIARHMPVLAQVISRLQGMTQAQLALALPAGVTSRHGRTFFEEPISGLSIKVLEGQTWDAMARSRLLLVKSGTVATEAAILGIPMVTFYQVNAANWTLFRRFVDVPFFTIVNLVAGRRVVPELIQQDMTAERIVSEAMPLLGDGPDRKQMIEDLAEVRAKLSVGEPPMDRAATIIMEVLETHGKTGKESGAAHAG